MSLKAKLEAVIYAAEEPVTLAQLALLFTAAAHAPAAFLIACLVIGVTSVTTQMVVPIMPWQISFIRGRSSALPFPSRMR